ncbi:MAG: hypothetical protein AAFY11_01830 [Cyanobacteria bacterium J06641_5]
MTEELHYILPRKAQVTAEVFAVHQLAWEFRREREMRLAHQHYCQWYREVARQHQVEHQRLQQQQQLPRQCLSAVANALLGWQRRCK